MVEERTQLICRAESIWGHELILKSACIIFACAKLTRSICTHSVCHPNSNSSSAEPSLTYIGFGPKLRTALQICELLWSWYL